MYIGFESSKLYSSSVTTLNGDYILHHVVPSHSHRVERRVDTFRYTYFTEHIRYNGIFIPMCPKIYVY